MKKVKEICSQSYAFFSSKINNLQSSEPYKKIKKVGQQALVIVILGTLARAVLFLPSARATDKFKWKGQGVQAAHIADREIANTSSGEPQAVSSKETQTTAVSNKETQNTSSGEPQAAKLEATPSRLAILKITDTSTQTDGRLFINFDKANKADDTKPGTLDWVLEQFGKAGKTDRTDSGTNTGSRSIDTNAWHRVIRPEYRANPLERGRVGYEMWNKLRKQAESEDSLGGSTKEFSALNDAITIAHKQNFFEKNGVGEPKEAKKWRERRKTQAESENIRLTCRAEIYGRVAANLSQCPKSPNSMEATAWDLHALGVINDKGEYISKANGIVNSNPPENCRALANLIQRAQRRQTNPAWKVINYHNGRRFAEFGSVLHSKTYFKTLAEEKLEADEKLIESFVKEGLSRPEARRLTRPIHEVYMSIATDAVEAFVKSKPMPGTNETIDYYRLTYELQHLGIFPPSIPF